MLFTEKNCLALLTFRIAQFNHVYEVISEWVNRPLVLLVYYSFIRLFKHDSHLGDKVGFAYARN